MRGRKRKPKYLEKPKKSNANQIDDKNKKPGSFVMYYDFETDLWYKCRILEEVGDLLQVITDLYTWSRFDGKSGLEL